MPLNATSGFPASRPLGRIAAILAAAFLASSALASPPGAANPLRGEVEVNRTAVLKGSSRVVYVRLSFEGLDLTPGTQKDRPALNLSLVLDRSGSMADEGKMDYLKRAATLAVDRLAPADTLSVVEYDDQISLLWPARRVTSVGELKALIERLEPRGSTNLAGGMMRGVEEAASALNGPASARGTITRVMLMSDGLANTGITEPREIAELVRAARRKGIRISALGLGRDYDEDLMQAIAENGGGRYHYIEHPSQMARIFQDELGTMFETCAQDVDLEFTGSARIRKAELIGFDEVKPGRSISHDLEDVYEGEKRSLLLRLELDAPAEGPLDLGKLTLRYRKVGSGETHEIAQDLRITSSTDATTVNRSLNAGVEAEAALAESDRIQKEQVRLYQQGRGEEARRNLSALATDLETRNRDLKDERVRRKIEALNVETRQMAEAANSVSAQKDYLKASKQRLYQAKIGKRTGFALQPGDRGREVELLQEALRKSGHYTGPVDGNYDDDVTKAVRAYQKANNIGVDGVAGAGTMDKLGLY